jgi:arginase
VKDQGRRITLLGAPLALGLARADPGVVPGVALLAAALRAAGLRGALGAEDGGDLAAPTAYEPERDPATGIRNPRPVAQYAARLADRVAAVLGAGAFPLVLGGDCSVLLGALLALRRRGRFGLFFLDGHCDFYPPRCSPSGQVAAMELWLATGHGPALLADLEGRRPLVDPRDVVLFGHRDVAERLESGAPDPAAAGIRAVPWPEVAAGGAAESAAQALGHLESRGLEGIWLHLDVDVLDGRAMPAVDAPQPGGLSFADLDAVLSRLLRSPRIVGADVTIFDPTLDPDGALARRLVALLRSALAAG